MHKYFGRIERIDEIAVDKEFALRADINSFRFGRGREIGEKGAQGDSRRGNQIR